MSFIVLTLAFMKSIFQRWVCTPRSAILKLGVLTFACRAFIIHFQGQPPFFHPHHPVLTIFHSFNPGNCQPRLIGKFQRAFRS